MFDKLKKAFSGDKGASVAAAQLAEIAAWAEARKLKCAASKDGNGFIIAGKLGDKLWKMECSPSTREYISGQELRGRIEAKVNDDVAVVIMSRVLKDTLTEQAYGLYTDTLQTEVRPGLLEEMSWLATYPGITWDTLPNEFWSRYTVLSSQRDNASAWVSEGLARLLMSWPKPGVDADVPWMLMLLRGKVHLRMQYLPDDLPTLAHAVRIMTSAGETAIEQFSTDITL